MFALLAFLAVIFFWPWVLLLVLFMVGCVLFYKLINLSTAPIYITIPTILMVIILLSTFVHLFIFEIYKVPSRSMENALLPGDHIFVSKVNYGPRMPRALKEIPWLNLFSEKKHLSFEKKTDNSWTYYRIKGFETIKREDIVVFKKSTFAEDLLVKRCLGLPGDKLQVRDGQMYINNIKVEATVNTIMFRYLIKINDLASFKKLAVKKRLFFSTVTKKPDGLYTTSVITLIQKKSIEKSPAITIVKHEDFQIAIPYTTGVKWTSDNWGPIIVPKKGLTVNLDTISLNLYNALIKSEINNIRKKTKDKLYGTPSAQYTFNNDYYFMMGDNRDNSFDSRFFGLVSEENIVGKKLFKF